MVQRTGIRRAVASRIKPHFWSWLMVAISPGGHHLLSDRPRADKALVSPRQADVYRDGGGS